MKRIATLICLLIVTAVLMIGAAPASARPIEYYRFTSVSCINDTVALTWEPIYHNPVDTRAAPIVIMLFDRDGNLIANVEFSYAPTGISTGGTFTMPQAMDAASVIAWNGDMVDDYMITGACHQTHLFNDGRLDQDNAYQSVALYCDNSTLIAYALSDSQGYLAFRITQAEIDRFPTHPAVNTLIKEAKGVRLYRLTTGELQVNRTTTDGKQYSFVLSTCVH